MEKFSLKWNDFTANVKESFQNLRNEEDFFDITLVGDDYKHVTAHKLVLSSCSEYFMNVFSNNKKHFQSHAMICLEGLNHADLNNILDYIYQGEVQLHQQELHRFLKIAERLKLEGLIDGEEEEAESNIDKNFEEKHEFSAAKSENKVVRNNEQALRNSCELLRQRKELHASS